MNFNMQTLKRQLYTVVVSTACYYLLFITMNLIKPGCGSLKMANPVLLAALLVSTLHQASSKN